MKENNQVFVYEQPKPITKEEMDALADFFLKKFLTASVTYPANAFLQAMYIALEYRKEYGKQPNVYRVVKSILHNDAHVTKIITAAQRAHAHSNSNAVIGNVDSKRVSVVLSAVSASMDNIAAELSDSQLSLLLQGDLSFVTNECYLPEWYKEPDSGSLEFVFKMYVGGELKRKNYFERRAARKLQKDGDLNSTKAGFLKNWLSKVGF
jgi:hypothetical protein